MRDFSKVRRIVIKVGTNLLSSGSGINAQRVRSICRQIGDLKNMGYQVILVSSGAVGLGAMELGHKNKVVYIPMRQACASIGQPVLMQHYREGFRDCGILTAQVLITRNDLNNRKTYNNLRASVSTLLSMGVVPVFNENDVVSIAEIGTAFGDNDRMSAMVASKIDAQLLILLTDIDGLYTGNPRTDRDAVKLDEVDTVTDGIMSFARGAGSTFSTGGMKTKLMAAKIAAMADCATVIACGEDDNVLVSILKGENTGTFIHPSIRLTQRQRWIINNSHSGSIVIDDGAAAALERHRSLLPSGVVGVSGIFNRGDVIQVHRTDGSLFGKAVTAFDSTELAVMMGHRSDEIDTILGKGHKDCIFRPEDLVVVKDDSSL